MALTQVASGLIASVAASTLTGTQTIPKGTLPTGSVLQVVTATTNNGGSYISTTSTSFVTTNFSVTITPSSASNKIYLISSGIINSSSNNARVTIYRGATNIGSSVGMSQTNLGGWAPYCVNYLDSPATTSATTYTMYYLNGGGATAYWGGDGQLTSFTALEISA